VHGTTFVVAPRRFPVSSNDERVVSQGDGDIFAPHAREVSLDHKGMIQFADVDAWGPPCPGSVAIAEHRSSGRYGTARPEGIEHPVNFAPQCAKLC
jgi:hypothetical protein